VQEQKNKDTFFRGIQNLPVRTENRQSKDESFKGRSNSLFEAQESRLLELVRHWCQFHGQGEPRQWGVEKRRPTEGVSAVGRTEKKADGKTISKKPGGAYGGNTRRKEMQLRGSNHRTP